MQKRYGPHFPTLIPLSFNNRASTTPTRYLNEDRENHRKQRHTAKRIFVRLREEHGFDGGYTITMRGETEVPGLYFLGLNYLQNRKSGIIYGVGEDAKHVEVRIRRFMEGSGV